MTDFFGAGSPFVAHPLLSEDRSAAEIDFVLEHSPGSVRDVLDIGCGFGRHALELARRGFRVVAIDPAAAMIAESKTRLDAAGMNVELIEIGGETFVRENGFDLAISMFTSFGQVRSESLPNADELLMHNVRRSLRPGGVLLIEVPERHRARTALVADETFGDTTVTRWFDEKTGVMHERFASPGGQFDLTYNLYTGEELASLVSSCGLVVRQIIDDAIVTPPNTFMTLVAECPAG